jgi:hypothetical protein
MVRRIYLFILMKSWFACECLGSIWQNMAECLYDT